MEKDTAGTVKFKKIFLHRFVSSASFFLRSIDPIERIGNHRLPVLGQQGQSEKFALITINSRLGIINVFVQKLLLLLMAFYSSGGGRFYWSCPVMGHESCAT
uniref:Uncharacterized protein n=1 Tax=Anopheles maculatus TaxID=74869 RepID=A0A182SRL8_9DIPT